MVGDPCEELTQRIKKGLMTHLPKNYTWPGNVRELEQAARRVLLKGSYSGDLDPTSNEKSYLAEMDKQQFSARDCLIHYAMFLYQKLGSLEKVARQMQLDRRTVKRYIDESTKT